MSEKSEHKITFRLDDYHYQLFMKKYRNSGCKSMSNFIRLMIFQGMLLTFDEATWEKVYHLFAKASNNINQIAARVNATGNVYDEDLKAIREGVEGTWQSLNYMVSLYRKVKR